MGLELLQAWVIGAKLFFLGVTGAAIAAWQDRKTFITRSELVVFMICGGFYGSQLATLTVAVFPSLHGSEGGVGFLLGMFGASLTGAIFRAIKNADLYALIKSKLGGGAE